MMFKETGTAGAFLMSRTFDGFSRSRIKFVNNKLPTRLAGQRVIVSL